MILLDHDEEDIYRDVCFFSPPSSSVRQLTTVKSEIQRGAVGVYVHTGECVHAVNARGPLIVSRTSSRRIDLSHAKRQIAVRRSFGSGGVVAGLRKNRERKTTERRKEVE